MVSGSLAIFSETITRFFEKERNPVVREYCVQKIYNLYKNKYILYEMDLLPLIIPSFNILKDHNLQSNVFHTTFHILIDIWKISKFQECIFFVPLCNDIILNDKIIDHRRLDVLNGLISLISIGLNTLHPVQINNIFICLTNLLVCCNHRGLLYLTISCLSNISCNNNYYIQIKTKDGYIVNSHLTCNSNHAIQNIILYCDITLLINGLKDCNSRTKDFRTYISCIEAIIILTKSPELFIDYSFNDCIEYFTSQLYFIKYEKSRIQLKKNSNQLSVDHWENYNDKEGIKLPLDEHDYTYLIYRLNILLVTLIQFQPKISKKCQVKLVEVLHEAFVNTLDELIKLKTISPSSSNDSIDTNFSGKDDVLKRTRSSSLSSHYSKYKKSQPSLESVDITLNNSNSFNYPTEGECTAELIRAILVGISIMFTASPDLMLKDFSDCFLALKRFILTCNDVGDSDILILNPLIQVFMNAQQSTNFKFNESDINYLNNLFSSISEILSNENVLPYLKEQHVDAELISLYLHYYRICPLKIREKLSYNLLPSLKAKRIKPELADIAREFINDSSITINYLFYKQIYDSNTHPIQYYLTPNSITSVYFILPSIRIVCVRKVWSYTIHTIYLQTDIYNYEYESSLYISSSIKYNLNPSLNDVKVISNTTSSSSSSSKSKSDKSVFGLSPLPQTMDYDRNNSNIGGSSNKNLIKIDSDFNDNSTSFIIGKNSKNIPSQLNNFNLDDSDSSSTATPQIINNKKKFVSAQQSPKNSQKKLYNRNAKYHQRRNSLDIDYLNHQSSNTSSKSFEGSFNQSVSHFTEENNTILSIIQRDFSNSTTPTANTPTTATTTTTPPTPLSLKTPPTTTLISPRQGTNISNSVGNTPTGLKSPSVYDTKHFLSSSINGVIDLKTSLTSSTSSSTSASSTSTIPATTSNTSINTAASAASASSAQAANNQQTNRSKMLRSSSLPQYIDSPHEILHKQHLYLHEVSQSPLRIIDSQVNNPNILLPSPLSLSQGIENFDFQLNSPLKTITEESPNHSNRNSRNCRIDSSNSNDNNNTLSSPLHLPKPTYLNVNGNNNNNNYISLPDDYDYDNSPVVDNYYQSLYNSNSASPYLNHTTSIPSILSELSDQHSNSSSSDYPFSHENSTVYENKEKEKIHPSKLTSSNSNIGYIMNQTNKISDKIYPKSCHMILSHNNNNTITPTKAIGLNNTKYHIGSPNSIPNIDINNNNRSRSSSLYGNNGNGNNTPQLICSSPLRNSLSNENVFSENHTFDYNYIVDELPLNVTDEILPLIDPFHKSNEYNSTMITAPYKPDLEKQVNEIDNYYTCCVHSIAVLYVEKHQSIDINILLNNVPSINFTVFLTAIGHLLPLTNPEYI